MDGEGPILADVELAALRDLDALLLHREKTENMSGCGELPTIPALSPFSKPADGCDEVMWPPDVSIALPEKAERHPRTCPPAWTHCQEILARLLHPGPPPGTHCISQHFLQTLWLEPALCPGAATEVSQHINKPRSLQLWDNLKLMDFCWP